MRTEREIRKKLARVRYELKHQKKPSLWRIMELQVYEDQLMWVLKIAPSKENLNVVDTHPGKC